MPIENSKTGAEKQTPSAGSANSSAAGKKRKKKKKEKSGDAATGGAKIVRGGQKPEGVLAKTASAGMNHCTKRCWMLYRFIV